MKEKPIIFSGEMVRAILEGRKTQTRRVIKDPQWEEDGEIDCAGNQIGHGYELQNKCPHGKPGDRLWVRETHGWVYPQYAGKPEMREPTFYRADYFTEDHKDQIFPKWRPSIHMPRWASRITLEITDVRVEKLKDISDEDALKEGYKNSVKLTEDGSDYTGFYPSEAFLFGDWAKSKDQDSWVWVIEFKRVET